MVNAWSLAGSILSGTFDEDYPIVKNEVEHSDAYYDYKRNDPDAENPFTDPKDRERADFVVGAGNTALDKDLEFIKNSGGFEWTPGSPWPPRDPEEDGLDYENDYYEDYMADIDEQRAHHFKTYDDGMSLQVTEETEMDQDFYEPKRAHFYKYHEEDILKDIEELSLIHI